MSRDALVIGINIYDNILQLPPLRSPSENAEEVARMLEKYGNFSVRRLPCVKDVKSKSLKVCPSTSLKIKEVREALIQLFKPEGKNIPDTALLFFCGHGFRVSAGEIHDGYLAASNSDPRGEIMGISLKWLRELLQTSPVRQQIIWLDTCHAAELFNFDEAYPGDRGQAKDLCFIAASREFEKAYQETFARRGVLSGALLKGLEPATQPDREVSNLWLCHFIAETLKKEKAPQTPIFRNFGEPIILTRCSKPPEIADTTPDKVPVSVCPYRGLAYFDCNEQDHNFFYGRNALTDQLLEKVREGNFVAVLGASGSGKSSVVRAGLLYQLTLGQRLSGSEQWKIRIFQPGEHPLSSLEFVFTDNKAEFVSAKESLGKGAEGFAEFIEKTAGNGRLVIVADQFEEVFTLCKDNKERQQFFETLLGALKFAGNKICLILAMRSDFFGKCSEQEYAGLADWIQSHLVTVIPMTPEELKQAIVEPAKSAGRGIEPELVTQMIEDVKDSPGSLPLLQYALTELWKQRSSDCLKLADYVKLGGVKGTLSKRADEIYNSFSPEEQETAKRIFIELTRLGEGTEDTRRRVSKQSLITSQGSEELVSEVIRKLADEKLIVTSEDISPAGVRSAVVDVAHEALIRHWGLLRTWLNENRDDIRFHRRLYDAAVYWNEKERPEGLLWRSPDLDLLYKFYKRKQGEMKALEIEFLKKSVKAKKRADAEKEAVRQRELEQAKALAEEQQKRAEEQAEAAKKLESSLVKNYWFNAAIAMEGSDWLKAAHFSAKAGTKQRDDLQVKNYILNIQDHIGNCFMVYQIQHERESTERC
ncbi:MAG: hypothetical protein BWK80_13855 [Desulfobacteraceae bacterium IS3]|nr:MAG: hypothetical protein BWK80_13855 [Desulfobacteraceae bacterium IS3]